MPYQLLSRSHSESRQRSGRQRKWQLFFEFIFVFRRSVKLIPSRVILTDHDKLFPIVTSTIDVSIACLEMAGKHYWSICCSVELENPRCGQEPRLTSTPQISTTSYLLRQVSPPHHTFPTQQRRRISFTASPLHLHRLQSLPPSLPPSLSPSLSPKASISQAPNPPPIYSDPPQFNPTCPMTHLRPQQPPASPTKSQS